MIAPKFNAFSSLALDMENPEIIMNKFTNAVYANRCDRRDLKYDIIKMRYFFLVGVKGRDSWECRLCVGGTIRNSKHTQLLHGTYRVHIFNDNEHCRQLVPK